MKQAKLLPKTPRRGVLSVVIPAFNEELVINETIDRVRSVLKSAKIRNEIIIVNDGSTDGTLNVLKKNQSTKPLRIINLSTNAGHMSAIKAGLEASRGEFVVTIDADLQDPPEYIPEMYKIISLDQKSSSGLLDSFCDVVQAYRADRTSDSIWKRQSASLYYKLIRKITGITLIPHAADFRMMKRHVVESLVSLPEKKLVFRLLIPSLGFRIQPFPIVRDERFAGKSKYTKMKMLSLATDSVIGFTYRPLRYLAFVGMTASVVMLLGSVVTLILFIFGDTLPGWPSLVLLILSFNAFLFAGLGLVGEYVGRIYQLVQGRPETPWLEIIKKA
jgi:dolichol-phosphate mannosyltransferase